MARKIQVEIVGDAKSLEKAFKRAGSAGDGFQRKMRTTGKVIGAGIGGGILAVGFALKRGFAELSRAQKVAAQTNAVLKSTGGIANVTAKHVDRLATKLSQLSGIDDEDIAAISNMLLTFTNIRNGAGKNEKVFDKATQAVLDLSVATGKDMTSAAVMVGKALNDTEVNAKGTITGWSALRRVGVVITKDMMEQGAAFIKAGKPMEAQKLLLKELQTEFGGSAKAFGSTMPGALGKLRNAFDEISAAFATGFLPLINKVAKALTKRLADPAFVARVERLGTLIGTKLYDGFVSISGWFDKNWPTIRSGMETAADIAQRFARAIRKAFEWLQKLANVTPGGEGTLIGLLLSGVLLAKAVKFRKAFLGVPGFGGKGKGKGGGGPKGGGGKGGGGGGGGPKGGFGGIKGGAVGLGLAGAGQQISADQGGFGDPRKLSTWLRLARQGELDAKELRTADRFLNDKQMGILHRVWAKSMATYGGPRADGGSVVAGMSYMVGERGPEMFVPGQSGTIVPNGGGGPTHIHVHVGSHKVAEAIIGDIQRLGKRGASQQRGRLGGQNLALS